MGFNVLGIVLSKQFKNKTELCKNLGIGEVEPVDSNAVFEEAILSYSMGDDDVYITEVGNGTLITFGVEIDYVKVTAKSSTADGGKGMTFIMGDSVGLYNLFYSEDGKGLRSLNSAEGKITDNRGNRLLIETEGKDISVIIFDLIGEITGVRFWDIEPEHPAQLFRRK